MQVTLIYIALAVLFALLISLFLYWFGKKSQKSILLAFLRFSSVLALLLLLINPKWENEVSYIEKPGLYIAVDNSYSIQHLGKSKMVKDIVSSLKSSTSLDEKFDVKFLSFGSFSRNLDSLSFDEMQTDLAEVLNQIQVLDKNENTAVALITDGNQTKGSSYQYLAYKKPVFPVVVGDTVKFEDLRITQINANPYAFLGNTFPVEVFNLYKGEHSRVARLNIYENKRLIHTEKLNFSKDKQAQSVLINLPAEKVGQHFYHVSVNAAITEKNKNNNYKDFTIEVVDQQSKILLLSSLLHPDLGALKKSIESNKQRKLDIKLIGNESIDFSKYQLVILYQPNALFASIYKQLDALKLNRITITGTKTDWVSLNEIQNILKKNTTRQIENFLPVFNKTYTGFVAEDIGFEALPPLQDFFGSVQVKVPYQTLLYQKINNIQREEPLLLTLTHDEIKEAVLFGEGLWKWRMQSKLSNQSFNRFDDFLGAVVQFVVSNKEFSQLKLDYKKMCFSNQEQVIKASFVDVNHQLNTQAKLWLNIQNSNTKKSERIPFYLKDKHYEVNLSNLKPANYFFTIKVANLQVQQSGSFKVLDYNIEQQFESANIDALRKIAENTGGELFFIDNASALVESLLSNSNFKGIQKVKKIFKPLIDWKWLLGFIVLSLSIEWFIRKYRGWI